jgi:3-hydroxyisobutyrate dehydrogenase-like beta-hydroxyacid dehydrogenase
MFRSPRIRNGTIPARTFCAHARNRMLQDKTSAAALAVFKHAIAKGHGDEDISAIVKSLRRN